VLWIDRPLPNALRRDRSTALKTTSGCVRFHSHQSERNRSWPPSVGFSSGRPVPAEVRLGAAYQSKHDLAGTSARCKPPRRCDRGRCGSGELAFNNTLGLRGGVNRDEVAAGVSYYQKLGNRYGMRLDYAFTVRFMSRAAGAAIVWRSRCISNAPQPISVEYAGCPEGTPLYRKIDVLR